MVVHDPDGATTAVAPASRAPANAERVVRATRAASGANPEFQAGCPQQVWPSGKRTS
ncbi:MAG: hypothetical protein WKF43_09980 [Acidimicrobiales bacterium]